MLEKVQTVVDNPGPWMIWLYGDYGVGKTVLACQFDNVLMLDTEGSRESLLNHPELVNTACLPITTWPDFKKTADEIILGKHAALENINTIVVDTVSTLQMKELNEQMKALAKPGSSRHPDLPSQNEYNINNTRIRKALLDLKERSGMNLLLISHIKEEQDDQGTTIVIRPGNSPSLSSTIASLCSGIFYLSSKTDSKGETTRTLKCMPTPRIRAKNRFASTLEREITNPTGADLMQAIKERHELARKYAIVPIHLQTEETSNA